MAIRIALTHQSIYHYNPSTSLGPQVVRLRPAPHAHAKVVGYSLKVGPEKHFINWQQDPYNNWLARLVFPEPVTFFQVTVDLVLDLSPINPFDFFLEPEAQCFPFEYNDSLARDLRPYLECLEGAQAVGPRFKELLSSIHPEEGVQSVDHLVRVNQMVNKTLGYTLRMEPGVQTPEETLEKGRGSCRDFSWLLVQLLRAQGLASRFVSGYSVQLRADSKPIDGPSGVKHDVVDLHAWVEVYLPGAGWVGLDATSGMLCTEGHVPLAASPDPSQASPIEGGLTACEVKFEHKMDMSRIHEDPRVTLPYSAGQWEEILSLGDQVDQKLLSQDVRLTMGGEPTFISVDDYEGEEWNGGAVGQDKYERSIALTQAMLPHCGDGGFIHYGQGKWYPGETLPRWAMAIYWRKDGLPIWGDNKWLASPNIPLGHTHDDAREFLQCLCQFLGTDQAHISPAFEDPLYYLWKEGRLPPGVKAVDNELADEEDRDRLRRVFENGLSNPVGSVLPIERAVDDKGKLLWNSGLWLLKGQRKDGHRIFLIPGDSPAGLRLPMESLPPGPPSYFNPTDPTFQAEDLPDQKELQMLFSRVHSEGSPEQDVSNQPSAPETPPLQGNLVRTAMACQPRNGILHVFMPPIHRIEDYLELLAAIEESSKKLDKPVIIEGYAPPVDSRIDVMKITPDPGVIEVNVAPSSNWRDLVGSTRRLYERARECRLGTEKFMLDGKHTGTGGGNHIVLGASHPLDSPFLRRPDLLRSFLSYWNNHPSMSYLFSGLFVGPTSQAPRVDEGRCDAIDELELAMMQFKCFDTPPPWMVDRWFRNLLTDLTGNTHRSEICIDKLYSPDSATGRLGLVEFRGFEMPPHPEMSLAQQLLIRALVAMFWERPYTSKLIRWQKRLHDRFLLPSSIREDFSEVLYDLHLSGMTFKEEWFDTHFEFRFPVAGSIEIDGVTIEVRHGIEPWLVLGEEPGAGGTVRSVDSSLERVQVSVKNLPSDGSYALALGDLQLPLFQGEGGESIGIRFRAWQPPHCLHPAISTHTPLVFNLVDLREGRAVGGAVYHSSHPGGVNYESRPVNPLSAEARRKERWVPFGHQPGSITLRQIPRSMVGLRTIDLRKLTLLS